MNMYTLLYLKWITNKKLLYSTQNSSQCCVAAWMTGEFGEWIMYMYGWVLFAIYLKLLQNCYLPRWQEYTEELHKKDLHDPGNHNGVITHLEPDILECEVKWALGSITMNKASGSDGIPVALFQILKDDAVKVLHSICQQIWKTK